MANPVDLYCYAESRGIDVDWISMERAESLSVMLDDGTCCIAINPWKMDSTAQETVCLAHELGHCEYGAFYNPQDGLDIRQKHENRADKWAIAELIGRDDLEDAVTAGHTELWDLAEWFGVTEDFMRKAVCWYQNGNLAVDMYLKK